MAHKTLIGGTAYEIKGGRTLVGGTGYDVKFSGEPIPVTLTGMSTSPNTHFALINGVVYSNTGNTEVLSGDVITFSVMSTYSSLVAKIVIDGVQVVSVSSGQQTLDWTVPDVSAITIGFSYTSKLVSGAFRTADIITVTTS